MMKIKTFEFMIHSWVGAAKCHKKDDIRQRIIDNYFVEHSRKSDPKHLWSPAEIDSQINEFACDKDVVDIKVENYTSDRHNNGGGDTVIAKYTILYKED